VEEKTTEVQAPSPEPRTGQLEDSGQEPLGSGGQEEEGEARTGPMPRPGTLLAGRYTVLEKLGQGGMGLVLSVYDGRLDRRVALKLLLHEDHERTQEARLLREAQAMARLSHPHVVAVYDAGTLEDGRVFIAMEYVEGRTLRAWCKEQPREWREVLKAFKAAGRGLAAAHAAGLIHRDFKPDNVLVGSDGRVRVMDFGVARSEAVPSPSSALPTEAWDSPLTQPGLVVGTPRYMAPELVHGQPADVRSDLFAFCVALYEALYGQPAFAGATRQQRTRAQLEGRVSPPPAHCQVPTWVSRAVLAGLQADPLKRPASMNELLALLRGASQERFRARLRMGALVVLPTLLALLGSGLWLDSRRARCAHLEGRLEGIWDESLKGQVRQALLGTGLSYATPTVLGVEAALDAYAQRWVRLRTEACEASWEQPGALQELAARQVVCLERRRGRLRALTELLSQGPDAKVLERAVPAVQALPPLESCMETQTPVDGTLARDSAVRAREETLNAQVDRLGVLFDTGKYSEGAALGEKLLREARPVDPEALWARAHFAVGRLRAEAGDAAGAEPLLRQAILLASGAREDALAAEIWSSLLLLTGDTLAQYDKALELWLPLEAAVKRAGDEGLRGLALNNLGVVLWSMGRYEEARERIEQSLALREKVLPPDHTDVADSLGNLGVVLWEMGRYEEARVKQERVLAIREKVLGPEHPSVAETLGNLGTVASKQGRYEDARALLERALAIREKALGPEHLYLTYTLGNLSTLMMDMGQYEQALALQERALAIRQKVLEPGHPDTCNSLFNIGAMLERAGRYEEARARLEALLPLVEKALGRDHVMMAYTQNTLGLVLQRLGQYAQARTWHERALATWEKVLGPDHPDRVQALNALGQLYLLTGQYAQAHEQAKRALASVEKVLGPDHPTTSAARVTLGRVLVHLDEWEEASRQLEHALTRQEKVLGPKHPRLADTLLGLAELRLAQHRPAEALPLLERALPLSRGVISAQVQFTLARALWASGGGRPRALELASKARRFFQSHQQRWLLVRASAWMATHSIRQASLQ
jgi:serine/threonine-protein kinase